MLECSYQNHSDSVPPENYTRAPIGLEENKGVICWVILKNSFQSFWLNSVQWFNAKIKESY